MVKKFDFDKWTELAKSDPNAFEKKRRETIEEFISSVPLERQKALLELQSKIEQKLA